MVANIQIKKPKIYTGETPVQELQAKFTDEARMMGKKAAIKLGCNVEQLKWRVANNGLVEFEVMTGDEMIQMQAHESQAKQVRDIKKARGVL